MSREKTSKNPMDSMMVVVPDKSESLLSEVRISGLSVVFNSRATHGLRIMWTVVLTVATVLMLAQVYFSVTYYLSSPISVQLKTGINKTMAFPMLTICNQNTWNLTAMERLKKKKAKDEYQTNVSIANAWHIHDYIGISGYTMDELWTFLAPRIDESLASCWFGGKRLCKDVGEWKNVFTVLGSCSTFSLKTGVTAEAGPASNLRMQLRDPMARKYRGKSGFRMLLHWPNETPKLQVATHGAYVYLHTTRHVRMTLKVFQGLDKPGNLCNKDPNYSYIDCRYRCFSKNFVAEGACRLPPIDDESERSPLCNSSESYQEASQVLDKLINSPLSMDTACNCTRSCKYIVLEKNTQVGHLEEERAEVIIYYNDLTYQAFTDSFSYSITFLLSDIGGAMGLMLGASLFCFIQIGEIGIMQIKRLVKKNQGKRITLNK